MRICHIVICGLSGSTKFFHIISQRTRFFLGEKKLSHIKFVLIFLQLLSKTFLILRRNERDIIKMSSDLHVQYKLFLSDIYETWIFSTVFRITFKCQISRKYIQWEPRSSTRIDRQTWRSQQSQFAILLKRLKSVFTLIDVATSNITTNRSPFLAYYPTRIWIEGAEASIWTKEGGSDVRMGILPVRFITQ